MALALHPAIQHHAQLEIDSIVGRDRLPLLGDRKSMPYIEAICREVLRWHAVIPLGVPRASIQADMYEGMLIPAGLLN
jgi:cytochrome P450